MPSIETLPTLGAYSLRTWLFLSVLLLLIGACAPLVPHQAPPVQLQEAGFSATGQAPLPQKWWMTFQDEQLDQLIEKSLAGNFSLQSAWDRLDRARATARKAGVELFPQVDGEAGYFTSRSSTNSRTRSSHNYNLGLVASYEIDLWGRIRSTKDAAELDAQASAEDLQTAALTLSAQVAKTWFQLLEQQGQIEILQQQLEINQKTQELISLQVRTGQVGIADLLQQRQLTESRRGELALAAGRAQVLRNQLAILLGLPPDRTPQLMSSNLGKLPPLPETGLQSHLLERRPDVRAAWLQMQSADQLVAAAVADRFPRLSLVGRASTEDQRIKDLFDDWLASLAANLVAPLIDGGRRRAEVDRTRALAAEALHAYGQTVLEALAEVEDALTQEQQQVKYLASINQQLLLAEQAIERIRDRYLNGAEDYQRVLGAVLSKQVLQRTQLSARRELFENRVNLCQALAGGWELTRTVTTPPSR